MNGAKADERGKVDQRGKSGPKGEGGPKGGRQGCVALCKGGRVA
jgi:hypothetical protein